MNKLTKTLSTAGLATAVLLSSMGAASASEVHYKDVSKSDNFYESVEYLLEENAISRTLPNFRPYENITRGQVASIASKVWDLENYRNPKLKDVPETHQFYPYIGAIVSEGIMTGYGYSGVFGVNDPLTRGQFAGIILNVSNIELVSDKSYIEYGGKVSDIFDGENFKGTWGQHIATLEVLGYMSGFNDGSFRQNEPIKRSQFANMIVKTIGYKDTRFFEGIRQQFEKLGVSREVATEKLKSLNSDVIDYVGDYEWFDPSFSSYHGLAVMNIKKEGEVLFEDINLKLTVFETDDPKASRKYHFKVEAIN